MQAKSMIVVLDFGGPYGQLVARRIREAQVYCEVLPCFTPIDKIKRLSPQGIVLSGSLFHALAADAPEADPGLLDLGIPVLGLGYGMHWMVKQLKGQLVKGSGKPGSLAELALCEKEPLFAGLEKGAWWMGDDCQVAALPEGFSCVGKSAECPIAAIASPKGLYGLQFHPESSDSKQGARLLQNFLGKICSCKADWTAEHFIEQAIEEVRQQVGQGTVLLGLSGGVDSAVVAALVFRAIGDRLSCVFVDHGFMRKNEALEVKEVFTQTFPVHLIAVDKSDYFFERVAGVTDPEEKRKAIGAAFIEVFTEEAEKLGKIDFLAQGTIYPDIIESGVVPGAAVIKSHHNVGGLPETMRFTGLVEPLRMLFKDEVRAVGACLGLPEHMVRRQPFPGPGLAVRTLGELTREKVNLVRESDAILREEISKAGLTGSIQQYFTVLTGIRSVGVRGNSRSYDHTIAIRAVNTDDFMVATWTHLPYELLETVSSRITSQVPGVNRVVYDVTSKPPAAIEWE